MKDLGFTPINKDVIVTRADNTPHKLSEDNATFIVVDPGTCDWVTTGMRVLVNVVTLDHKRITINGVECFLVKPDAILAEVQ